MPRLDDNTEELDSSADSEALDVANEAAEAAAADAAANSSDANGETEEDLLSVVRDVVDESRKPAEAASPAEGEDDGQSAADPSSKKEQDDEDYSDVPFHKHPRFQHLLRKSKELQTDATRYRNVQNFMDGQGLEAEEVADGLVIMGLMKTNPREAWARMKPVVQKLLIAAGEVLPEDLAQRVQNGEMSQEAAQEVSRSRADVQTVQHQRTFEEQQAARRQHNDLVKSLGDAANAWEADRRKKDPNFAAKFVPIQKELTYLQATEGKPTTPDGVRDQLARAYKAVNEQVRVAAAPDRRKPALRPVTGGQANGNAKPQPTSTLDIVRANRRASR